MYIFKATNAEKIAGERVGEKLPVIMGFFYHILYLLHIITFPENFFHSALSVSVDLIISMSLMCSYATGGPYSTFRCLP